MKRTLTLAAAALAALTLVAAGCGDSDEVPADAVAVVDGTEITRASLDELMARAKKSYSAQKRAFPKAGTSDYQQLRAQAVAYLVQRAEYFREAEGLGVEVPEAKVTSEVAQVKKQYFGNDQQQFEKGLREQGYTVAAFRAYMHEQLVRQGIYEKVTDAVKVSDADVRKHYDENRNQYSVAASREVRHILVKTKAEADELRAQLVGGADFATLAKKSSLDPGSKDQGGKLTVTRGQTVAPFDKAAFSLKVNELSAPIKTEFGYHLIQPLAAVKDASVTPFARVKSQIRSELLTKKKEAAINDWVSDTEKKYEGKVTYATGFEPPDSSATTDKTTTDE